MILIWFDLIWLTQRNCKVRFDLQYTNGTWFFSQYSSFSVGDSSTNYTLTIGGWSGDTGDDELVYNNGKRFATYDFDQSGFCSNLFGGGFWYEEIDCGTVLITTSLVSYFIWPDIDFLLVLNAAEIRLLC